MRLKLTWENRELSFHPVALHFDASGLENVFAAKNNKTLRETLAHHRYRKFENVVIAGYSEFLDWKLGKFLLRLKSSGDDFYLSFLNKYGDESYCQFHIEDKHFQSNKGLYAYTVAREIRYIGRCRDSFRRRVNQGHGRIHPKNCYIDGQATNCYLNALIAMYQGHVEFWVHVMSDNEEIVEAEKWLIARYNPLWNIAH
jgi:hypothetical protein